MPICASATGRRSSRTPTWPDARLLPFRATQKRRLHRGRHKAGGPYTGRGSGSSCRHAANRLATTVADAEIDPLTGPVAPGGTFRGANHPSR